MSRCADEEDCKWQPWCRIEGKCRRDTTATPVTQASDTPRCGKLVERLRHEASLRDHYGDPILEDAADCIEKLERALATARADGYKEGLEAARLTVVMAIAGSVEGSATHEMLLGVQNAIRARVIAAPSTRSK